MAELPTPRAGELVLGAGDHAHTATLAVSQTGSSSPRSARRGAAGTCPWVLAVQGELRRGQSVHGLPGECTSLVTRPGDAQLSFLPPGARPSGGGLVPASWNLRPKFRGLW